MKLKLTKKQTVAYKAALSGDYTFILYGGAIRGGKTIWLLSTFVELCSRYPGSRWVILRESVPTLKRTTFVSWNKVLSLGLSNFVKHVDNTNHTWTFINGSQLIFMGENFDQDKELTRFSGLEVNGFGGDELNELQKATFDKLFERAGSYFIPGVAPGDQPPPLVLGTCNPTQNWVKGEVYDKYVNGTLPEGWLYIPAKITDNPHIPISYLKSLKDNLPPKKYEQYVLGDWEAKEIGNAFATYFSLDKHVRRSPMRDDLPLFLAMDFNLNPLGAIAAHIWADEYGFHVHVVDELEIESGSIPALIDEIKTRYARYLPSIMITGDAMGKAGDITERDNASIYTQIQRGLGIKSSQFFTPGNPTHANSRADVNYVLYNHPDLSIDPDKCPNTVRDLSNVECDAFGTIIKKNRKDLNQRADHLDCFRYLVNAFLHNWIKLHQSKPLPSSVQVTQDIPLQLINLY